jgi:hypothetical protein
LICCQAFLNYFLINIIGYNISQPEYIDITVYLYWAKYWQAQLFLSTICAAHKDRFEGSFELFPLSDQQNRDLENTGGYLAEE